MFLLIHSKRSIVLFIDSEQIHLIGVFGRQWPRRRNRPSERARDEGVLVLGGIHGLGVGVEEGSSGTLMSAAGAVLAQAGLHVMVVDGNDA